MMGFLFVVLLCGTFFLKSLNKLLIWTKRTTYLNWANHLVLSPLKQVCVLQNYTQRTTYLNWTNHLVLSPLKQVCVFQNYT